MYGCLSSCIYVLIGELVLDRHFKKPCAFSFFCSSLYYNALGQTCFANAQIRDEPMCYGPILSKNGLALKCNNQTIIGLC